MSQLVACCLTLESRSRLTRDNLSQLVACCLRRAQGPGGLINCRCAVPIFQRDEIPATGSRILIPDPSVLAGNRLELRRCYSPMDQGSADIVNSFSTLAGILRHLYRSTDPRSNRGIQSWAFQPVLLDQGSAPNEDCLTARGVTWGYPLKVFL